MKFEFKPVPVPKWAKKKLPKTRIGAAAFKVRDRATANVLGTVITFDTPEGEAIWMYAREGKLFGDYDSKVEAAHKLAAS